MALVSDNSYGWRTDDTNREGLTWPEWFYAAGQRCYSVDARWSPVLIEHENLFDAWRWGEDPTEYKVAR